jgi:NitT/TauT family transport system ATP-binding protein
LYRTRDPSAETSRWIPSRRFGPILKFEKVGFQYDGRAIMRDVSFAIRPGELVAVLGPSGCGKTTILNMVAGFLQPTEGAAIIDGQEITDPGPDRGVVFQAAALYDWMTVADNISFSLRCAGRPKAERRRVAVEMAALVNLTGFEDAYPYQLSGGMRQRVGLARVLAAKPKVMLMDEPFSALDAQTREIMQTELLRIWDEGRKTVLFVTHQIDEAVFLADRVLVFGRRPGRIVETIDVALPRPRLLPLKRTPEFVLYVDRIWRLIEDDVRTSVIEERV